MLGQPPIDRLQMGTISRPKKADDLGAVKDGREKRGEDLDGRALVAGEESGGQLWPVRKQKPIERAVACASAAGRPRGGVVGVRLNGHTASECSECSAGARGRAGPCAFNNIIHVL